MLASLTSLLAYRQQGHALKAADRVRLFRSARLLTAAVLIATFPLLPLTSWEHPAAIAALVLFAILPAAIAANVKRPAELERAVLMAFLATSIVLLAGAMRGLSISLLTSLLLMQSLEAFLVVRRRYRRKVLACAGMTTVAMASWAIAKAAPFATVLSWSSATMSLLLALQGCVIIGALLAQATQAHRRDEEQNLLLQDVEEVSSETVVVLDASGRSFHVSRNADRVMGLPVEALMGRGLAEMVLVSDRPAYLAAVSTCIHTSEPQELQFRLRTSAKAGTPSYRWVQLSVKPSALRTQKAVGILRDIEAKLANQALLKTLEQEAETAKSARGAFLSTVTHELRTPLNAIIGFSEILSNAELICIKPERSKEYAGLIHGAGHELLSKVNAMVDVSRLESGTYDMHCESNDLKAMIDSQIEAFKQNPESHGIQLVSQTGHSPVEAYCDPRAVHTVLLQLLSNAVKFGDRAKPIMVELREGKDDIALSINNGGGVIPAETLALLATPFSRADESLKRTQGGIGLGLSLARGLMDIQNGSMTIRSESRTGTTISLTFCKNVKMPVQIPSFQAHPASVTSRAPSLSITSESNKVRLRA